MIVRLIPLITILLSAWLMVFLGAWVIFVLIAPIPDLEPSRLGVLLTAVLKALLVAFLVALWVFLTLKLRDAYMKRHLKPDNL